MNVYFFKLDGEPRFLQPATAPQQGENSESANAMQMLIEVRLATLRMLGINDPAKLSNERLSEMVWIGPNGTPVCGLRSGGDDSCASKEELEKMKQMYCNLFCK